MAHIGKKCTLGIVRRLGILFGQLQLMGSLFHMISREKSVELRVGHYQAECEAANLEANTAKVIKGLKWAESEKIDIMTFPETFLTVSMTSLTEYPLPLPRL